MSDLRYPIGQPELVPRLEAARRGELVTQVADAPARLAAAVAGLTPAQLDTPYRPGGWTVRQVVHHVSDSHLNAYVRFRLALTEDEPLVKTYQEARWAELADARAASPEVSLALLDALHRRWVMLLESLAPEDFARTLRHPELGPMTLDQLLCLYAWHGRHHAAHITGLREREGW